MHDLHFSAGSRNALQPQIRPATVKSLIEQLRAYGRFSCAEHNWGAVAVKVGSMDRAERFGPNRANRKVQGIVPLRKRKHECQQKDSEPCEPVLVEAHSEHEVAVYPRKRKSNKRQPAANYFRADSEIDGFGMDLDAFQPPKAQGALYGAKKAAGIEDKKWRSARDDIVKCHYRNVVDQRAEALVAVYSRVECWRTVADQQTCDKCRNSYHEQVVRVVFLAATADVTFKLRRCDMCV
jgi:hypothetical protein